MNLYKRLCITILIITMISSCVNPLEQNQEESNQKQPKPDIQEVSTPAPNPKPAIANSTGSKERIKEIAKKTTVSITQANSVIGSGVIIGENNHIIYVLTARHVISIKPERMDMGNGTYQPGTPYKVITNDGEEFEVGNENYDQIVKQLPNDIDLALLVLESRSQGKYKDRVAVLESSVSRNMKVYIFGYLPCSLSAKAGQDKQKQFSLGNITQVKSKPEFDNQQELGGYDIQYSNNTVKGMSGSPVFNADGYLVGIHTKEAERQRKKPPYKSEECQPLPSEPTPDYSANLGISIKRFLDLKSGFISDLQPILKINDSGKLSTQPNIETSISPTKTLTPKPNDCGSAHFIGPEDECFDDNDKERSPQFNQTEIRE